MGDLTVWPNLFERWHQYATHQLSNGITKICQRFAEDVFTFHSRTTKSLPLISLSENSKAWTRSVVYTLIKTESQARGG